MNFRRMILAQLAVGVGAGGIEVPQPDRRDAVGALEVRQRLLDGELRLAVGVDRRRRMRLPQRRLCRLAVDGGGGREDEAAAAFRGHRLERAERPGHVVAVIAGGIGHRLGHREPRREVHDGGGAALAQRGAHGGHVPDIAFDERRAERRVAVSGRQVVVDDDAVPGLAEGLRRMAADVAGAAGDEYRRRATGGQWSGR
jgi:hypothetical protein